MEIQGGQLINGVWQLNGDKPFESTHPGDNRLVWQGYAASSQQITQAVQSARTASHNWSGLSFTARCGYVEAYAKWLEREKEAIARCISEDNGKPLWEANTEVAAMMNKVAVSIQAYQERTGDKGVEHKAMRQVLRHKPHGVMLVLAPFNFPGHLLHGQVVPALLAGNTVVVKPSELTPKVGALLVQGWQEVDLPTGVVNLLQGGGDVGAALVQSDVNAVVFTGSYATGRAIHSACAGQPEKLVALEMGGNNPLVVVNYNDIEAACLHIIQSSFITAGQRCTCARRLILVEDDNTDALLERLCILTAKLRVGCYDDEHEPFMGPVISSQAALRLCEHVRSWQDSGAKSLLQGDILKEGTGLIAPSIVDMTACLSRPDEELFGPVLQVIRVGSFDEALTEANATRYGLAAGMLTDDAALFQTFSQHIRAGIVNWNRPLTGALSTAPFGGIGFSGNHRPSAYYAADYCAYPVVGLEAPSLVWQDNLPQGLTP